TIDLHPQSRELWVKPQYRAVNDAVELAATSADIPAAVAAPPGLPELRFDCDKIDVSEPLGVAFAKGLRLTTGEGLIAPVKRILPLPSVGSSTWGGFTGQPPGLDQARLPEVVHLMCPFGEEDAIREFAASKELI